MLIFFLSPKLIYGHSYIYSSNCCLGLKVNGIDIMLLMVESQDHVLRISSAHRQGVAILVAS